MKWLKKIFFNHQTNSNSQVGTMGEDAVAQYVTARGMRILHRNWRHGRLELDLICEESETIVFVEVKTRKTLGKTSPVEGLSKTKRASILRAAKMWLTKHDMWHRPCRFDVAGVLYNAKTLKVEYYDNALDLSEDSTLGSGNTSWQPW